MAIPTRALAQALPVKQTGAIGTTIWLRQTAQCSIDTGKEQRLPSGDGHENDSPMMRAMMTTWIQRPRVTAVSRSVSFSCRRVTTESASKKPMAYCDLGSAWWCPFSLIT